MAFIECRECKHRVSNKAETCPNCGVKIATGIGFFGYTFIIVGAIVVFSLLGKSPTPSSTPEPVELATTPSVHPLIPQPVINTWHYAEETDAMTSGTVKTATIQSNNKIDLDSPYSGGTNGSITIRKHPRWGTDVLFQINKGQLLCSYSNCKVNVRFDDKKTKSFTANEPDDHSSETLFISDSKGFIANIKQSKKVIIEATFYHNGSFGFEFNTENLDWGK